MILFYLASMRPAAVMRANKILFLALLDIGIIANMLLHGLIDGTAIPLAAAMGVPYGLGSAVGQGEFAPTPVPCTGAFGSSAQP